MTGLIWATEAMRLFFVIAALGFTEVHLGISGAFFVALAASLLTAIPFTPAGLGIVELGVLGILTVIYGIDQTDAAAIILVDRAISVFSIWIFGSIAYVLSDKTKTGRRPAVEASATPSCTAKKSMMPAFRPASDRCSRALDGERVLSFGWASVRPWPRAGRSRWSCDRAVLPGSREAPHAQSEVVLHHLANLRLGQQIVGAQRVLDARRWVAGRRRDEAEVVRSLGFVAQLAQAAGELGGCAERRCAVAADQPRDRRMIDARLLRQLALRHLLRLKLSPQPLVEGSPVLDAHRILWVLRWPCDCDPRKRPLVWATSAYSGARALLDIGPWYGPFSHYGVRTWEARSSRASRAA